MTFDPPKDSLVGQRKNQEEYRLAVEEETKRIQREAHEAALQQDREARIRDAEFHSLMSATASTVRRTQGDGRRANLQRSLQQRQPAQEVGIRYEAEGVAGKLFRSGKQFLGNMMSRSGRGALVQ